MNDCGETTGMAREFDVVILGGGPAGTATALALRRHDPSRSVALVEATAYREVRVGETLPPQVRSLLDHLGVWDAFRAGGHAAAYGTSAVWGDDEPYHNEFIYSPYGEGWHLDRARFDAMLARQAEERGSALFTRSVCVGHRKAGDGSWRLEIKSRDRCFALGARFVVDATGRQATFARRQGASKVVFDRLLGIYVFFDLEGADRLPATHTLVEGWEEGWWYSARLPGDRLVVACMSDADRVAELGLREPERWRAQLDRTRFTRRVLQAARPRRKPICKAAHSQRIEPVAGDGWLAVGDAATTFDPLSSHGIFKALHFGIFAAYAVADHLRGTSAALDKYRRLVARDFEGYLETRAEYYQQEQRWPASPFWRRRFGQVTLDPMERLRAVPAAARVALLRKPSMHLPASELERLCSLCRPPRAAHQVVAEFQRREPSPLPDQRIILALQYLLEHGALTRGSDGDAVATN